MKAVQLSDHEAIWFDKRRPISIINLINVKGFILNVPSDYKIAGLISLPWERKHWIAVTKINERNSKLDFLNFVLSFLL
jgi:josephin